MIFKTINDITIESCRFCGHKDYTCPEHATIPHNLKEKNAQINDIIETPNGNRYLVLPNGKQAYIGNKNFNRSDFDSFVPIRQNGSCKIIGKLMIYINGDQNY